jgi:hypothetical protein
MLALNICLYNYYTTFHSINKIKYTKPIGRKIFRCNTGYSYNSENNRQPQSGLVLYLNLILEESLGFRSD